MILFDIVMNAYVCNLHHSFSTNRKMCEQKKTLYACSLDNLLTLYGFSTKCDVSYTFRWKQHLSKRLQAGTSPVARSHILSRRENAVWFLPKRC